MDVSLSPFAVRLAANFCNSSLSLLLDGSSTRLHGLSEQCDCAVTQNAAANGNNKGVEQTIRLSHDIVSEHMD